MCVCKRERHRGAAREGAKMDADTAVIIFFSPEIDIYIYITRTADDSDGG